MNVIFETFTDGRPINIRKTFGYYEIEGKHEALLAGVEYLCLKVTRAEAVAIGVDISVPRDAAIDVAVAREQKAAQHRAKIETEAKAEQEALWPHRHSAWMSKPNAQNPICI